MPKNPTPDWKTIELDLPLPVRRKIRRAAKLAGFTEEEMIRAIVVLEILK